MEKWDIFISYSNANKEKVLKIVNTIKLYGVSCWFQLRDSKQQFIEEINQAINHSSDFVVFLSNESISSLMVRNEITRAILQQKKQPNFNIVPVVIDTLTDENQEIINLFLGSINWLYENEYPDDETLVLSIFEQAGINPQTEENFQSIYSTEKEVEKARLEAQNRYLNVYAKRHLKEIFNNYDKPSILDIGCDTGENILLRLEGKDFRCLIEVDHNPSAIEKAVKLSNEKISFACCDVTSDSFFRTIFPLMQKHNIIGFDIIHISAVLLHLKDANELLKNLYMLLNPRGTIFIQDEDDGLNIVYPYSKFYDNCFYIWEHSKESGDRKMARKLPLMLHNAGFSDVQILSDTISSEDYQGKYKEELWDLYFNPELWAADSASYFDNYEAFDLIKDVKEKHNQMKADYMQGKYFIMLGIIFILATK